MIYAFSVWTVAGTSGPHRVRYRRSTTGTVCRNVLDGQPKHLVELNLHSDLFG